MHAKVVAVDDVALGVVHVQARVGLADLERAVHVVGEHGHALALGVDADRARRAERLARELVDDDAARGEASRRRQRGNVPRECVCVEREGRFL